MESYSGVPLNRVYRVDYEGGKGNATEEVCVNFFYCNHLDAKRWIYSYCGSPLHHCQVCVQGLIYNIFPSFTGKWGCEELWVLGSSELAIQVRIQVPSDNINWDRILAVSVDKKMITLKTVLYFILRTSTQYKDIEKPCPDCVSTAKEILGTMGIFCSGELPVELYESLVDNYEHEETRYRKFL